MLGFLNVNEVNERIDSEEGKIYWDQRKGYTSKLMSRLLQSGYYYVIDGKEITLKDRDGDDVVKSYSWKGILFNVAQNKKVANA